MKKNLILISLVCLFAFLLVPCANAQKSSGASQNQKFYINLGAMTDDSFDNFYWQVGAMLDLPIGNNLLLSPEAMLVGYKFDFDWFNLYPGATLNLLLGKSESQLFVGGGLLLFLPIQPSEGDTELQLKINGGFISDNSRLTVYIMTPFDDIFGYMMIGANFGFSL